MKKIITVCVMFCGVSFAVVKGNITTGSACIAIDSTGQGTIGISVQGLSGTLLPQVSINGDPISNALVFPSGSSTSQSTITANGVYSSPVVGTTLFQICPSGTITGTAIVTLTTAMQSSSSRGSGGGGNLFSALTAGTNSNAGTFAVSGNTWDFSGAALFSINSLQFKGATSGSATIQAAAVAGSPQPINLPIATGSARQALTTDAGTPQQTSWAYPVISDLQPMLGPATVPNGNNPLAWNWALTTDATDGFACGETSAATNGTLTNGLANQSICNASTLTGSTATPLEVAQGSQTSATAFPAAQFEPNWNAAGTTQVGVVIDANDTASASGSHLLLLRDSHVTEVDFDKAGNGRFTGGLSTGTATIPSAGVITFPAGGSLNSADTGTPTITFGTSKITLNQPLNLGVTTNQLVTGTTTNLTTSNYPASSGAVTLTFPNVTTNMLGGNSDTTTTHVLHATATGGIGNFSALATGDLPTGYTLDKVAGAGAAATGTEAGTGDVYTFAGVETGNLTAPISITDANSTNNNTNIGLLAGVTGTSTGGIGALIYDVSGTGDIFRAYTGGSVAAGVYTVGTKQFAITSAGTGLFGAATDPTKGTAGGVFCIEGTAPTGTSTNYGVYCNSTDHSVHIVDQTVDIGPALANTAAVGNNQILKTNNTVGQEAASSITDNGTTIASTETLTIGTAAGSPAVVDKSAGFLAAAMGAQTSATCTNITNMTWNIAANKNYILKCEIPMTLAASATIQYCLGGPGTATSFSLMADGDLGTAGIWSQVSTLAQTAYGTKTNASAAVAANSVQHVWAGIQNGATASGTALTLQTAANGTNAITVGANASCQLTQVN